MRRRVLAIIGLCAFSIWCTALNEAGAYELSRGRQLLLGHGLQLQSLAYPNSGFSNMGLWSSANFTTLDVHVWSDPGALAQLPAGQQWSRDYEPTVPYTKYLSEAELPYANNLVMYLYSDEMTNEQLSDPATLSDMAATYAEWRTLYPNALVGSNMQASIPTNAILTNYKQVTQPDLVMSDVYPGFSSYRNFADPARRAIYYSTMQKYRMAGLVGNDGTGTKPIAYAWYTDLYRPNIAEPIPNESFVRLQHNAAWAFGYTILDAFVYNYVVPDVAAVMFSGTDDSSPTVVFDYVKEANRQSRNLGPALVRLVSSGVYMKPGSGQSISGTGLPAWNAHAGNTVGYTDYITAITPTVSQGGATDTSYGDTLVGYFEPLLADNSDATFADGLHFMIVNGAATSGAAGAGIPVNASGVPDPVAMQAGSAAALAQWYRIGFDFTGSQFNSLVRLSRDTGKVELVPLTSNGGSNYYLDLNLPGGTGDLFAFWNGSHPLPTLPPIPEPPLPNLVANGGFQTGNFTNWRSVAPSGAAPTITNNPAEVYEGPYAAVLTKTSTSDYVVLDNYTTETVVTPGDNLRVSYAVKRLAGDSASQLEVAIIVKGPTGSWNVQTDTVNVDSWVVTNPGTDYSVVSFDTVIPNDAFQYTDLYFAWRLVAGGPLGTFAIDAVSASVLTVPEPNGDYNQNGIVDAADYIVWRKTLNQTGFTPGSGADGNANGTIDSGDYDFWKQHFGNAPGSGSGTADAAPVPEPSTLLLLASGVIGLLVHAQRKRNHGDRR